MIRASTMQMRRHSVLAIGLWKLRPSRDYDSESVESLKGSCRSESNDNNRTWRCWKRPMTDARRSRRICQEVSTRSNSIMFDLVGRIEDSFARREDAPD